jgi:hypothetical protein
VPKDARAAAAARGTTAYRGGSRDRGGAGAGARTGAPPARGPARGQPSARPSSYRGDRDAPTGPRARTERGGDRGRPAFGSGAGGRGGGGRSGGGNAGEKRGYAAGGRGGPSAPPRDKSRWPRANDEDSRETGGKPARGQGRTFGKRGKPRGR